MKIILTGINKEDTNTPDHPKNHPPKSARFNQLSPKKRKSPMDCFPLMPGSARALITDLAAPNAPEKARPQRVILSEGGIQFQARRVWGMDTLGRRHGVEPRYVPSFLPFTISYRISAAPAMITPGFCL